MLDSCQVFTTPFPKAGTNLDELSIGGGQGPRATTTLPPREEYLARIARGEIGAIYLITGQSGSGKSFLLREMKKVDEMIEPANRLISRARRDCDAPTDQEWSRAHSTCPGNLLFTYGKFGGHYGFTRDLLGRALEGKSSSVIVGDVGKVLGMYEALESLLPLVPIVSIRIDVPLDVAAARVTRKRTESYHGEANFRAVVNGLIEKWEQSQLDEVKVFTGLHTLVNLAPDEYADRDLPKEVQPLTGANLRSLLTEFRSEHIRVAKNLASEIARVRVLSEKVSGVSPLMMKTLTQEIAVVADQLSVPLVLKGGLAVALYLHSVRSNAEDAPTEDEHFDRNRVLCKTWQPQHPVWRTVSPDIDFAVASSREVHGLSEVFRRCGASLGELRTFTEKPLFKSEKLTASLTTQQSEMLELDGIVISRVKPLDSNFCFNFPYDDVINFHRRTFRLVNGLEISVIPPELLVVEKLVAARGARLNKFDLFDAATLIATQPINLTLIKRLVETQEYSQEALDSDGAEVMSLLMSKRLTSQDSERLVSQLGIKDVRLQSIINRRLASRTASPIPSDQKLEIRLTRNLSAMKQLALIDRLLSGIKELRAVMESPANPESPLTLRQSFGLDDIESKFKHLEHYLLHLARFHVGRDDIFINRNR